MINSYSDHMKIVVSGPLQCGKSSYVKFLDKKAMNVEAKGRDNRQYTVGMDLGTLKLNGFDIFIFGTPGLIQFSIMRDIIADGADGIVFMFDAARPETDNDAISILNSIRKLIEPNTPIVFLANKQDFKNARSGEVVKAQNKLPSNFTIFPTSTTQGTNVEKSLKYIVNEVYEHYKELLQVIKNYETNIKGLAEKLKKDKSQIRDFLNNLEIKRFIEIDRIKKTFKVREGLKNIT